MVLIDLAIVMLLTVLASADGMTMTSRVTPYQVTFGADGRLRMEDFNTRTACGYEEPVTTAGQGEGYSSAPTTAFYGTPQSPCATLETWTNTKYTIPVDGRTISFPVRLDFTLKNPESNLIEVRFMEEGNEIYTVKFRHRDDEVVIEGSSESLDLEFNESRRFWVTYENGEIKVGLHGINDPLIEFTNPDFTANEVDGIELFSKGKTPTEWKFYEPCTFNEPN